MAQQSRSVIALIIKNFINSLKPRSFKGSLMGKDHFGNNYYEINQQGQRKERWFDPKEKDKFDQELPAEWESWLRYRRKDPPLEEEVLANAALAKQKKLNAAKLEAERKKPEVLTPLEPKDSINSFPSYKDYERYPGEKG